MHMCLLLRAPWLVLEHCSSVSLVIFAQPQCFTFYSDDDDGGDSDGAPWWAGRGDFTHPALKPSAAHSDRSDPGGGEDHSDVSSGDMGRRGVCGKKTVQFTEYSMTSSIVPRSEGKGSL